ncbi:Xaa-Pro aminopeptidase [Hypericibacter terrae]|uniref:Xaa-Pro aminopeptidase n=1 Tax=Hypericibacter terrae TaxID=2602015 RepID=A0A5J6MEF3_9PROT|nr:Xaa-Pro aminopeptidase [Hypericibacter terrae]
MAALLKLSGSRLDINKLRHLVAGVVSAPRSERPKDWMTLVAPSPDAALERQLVALEEEIAAGRPVELAARGADRGLRLAALRKELVRQNLNGFLVPRADEFQGEYVPPRADRLAWLTGFTGSAGLALALADRAAVFIDGRYTLQVRDEVDGALYEYRHITDEPADAWLSQHFPTGGRLGYDPWLHTADGLISIREAVERRGGQLVACERNPVDAVWTDQPAPPIAPVVVHPIQYSGREAADKRAAIGAELEKAGIDAAVISQPASIAWLLNVRGADVPRTPLPLGFALAHRDGTVELFMEPLKLAPGLEAHLGNGVSVSPPAEFGRALERLGNEHRRILIDRSSAALWIVEKLKTSGASTVMGEDPCALPKACKNDTELAGMRNAHRRDGVAVTRFLAWLDINAAKGEVDELIAVEKLAQFRRMGELFRDFSFDTISGAGPNGAIVHYRSSPRTNRKLQAGELFLLDSGAQYLDGTTDITRTIAIGTPSPEMRDRFTRVLKGHIALGAAKFPRGTSGSQLDALARRALWEVGLDYDHGTGHGVGSYLAVHEGPHRISKVPNRVALLPGMIVSNEPGYYKTGAYGIRVENLVAVRSEPASEGGLPMLSFETITLAPIDRRLVETKIMTADEIAWLDAYHQRVRESLTPLLDAPTATWLAQATRPVGA